MAVTAEHLTQGDHVDLAELDAVEPWRADAACREVDDPSIFFPTRGETTEPAKAVCERCLVRKECLEFALRRGINQGVFGGASAVQRRRLRLGAAAGGA